VTKLAKVKYKFLRNNAKPPLGGNSMIRREDEEGFQETGGEKVNRSNGPKKTKKGGLWAEKKIRRRAREPAE